MPVCRRAAVAAFTLVELLVVITIIGILAALLSTAVVASRTKVKIGMAKVHIENIKGALARYETDYSQFPASSSAQTAAIANGGTFTFGGTFADANGTAFLITTPGYTADNSEVMGVLLDVERFNNGTPTINVGHVKNSKGEKYLREQGVPGIGPSGIGEDGIYRDPWGSPYIISLNLQRDSRCADMFYKRQSVSQTAAGSSQGFNGLVNSLGNPNTDFFERAAKTMVWSVGPNKRADLGVKANAGVNQDNVVGWK